MPRLAALLLFAIAGAAAGTLLDALIPGARDVRAVCIVEFAAVSLRYGAAVATVFFCVLLTLFTAAAMYDTLTMLIPTVIPASAFALFFIRASFFSTNLAELCERALYGVICAAVVAASMYALARVARAVYKTDALGGGDIELFAVIGMWFGVCAAFKAVALSCVFGLVFCAARGVGSRSAFPFAPSISTALFALIVTGGAS